jgi:hypothetical protein
MLSRGTTYWEVWWAFTMNTVWFCISKFYDFRQQTRRQIILDWMMIASITRIQSLFNFLSHQIFIFYCRYQIPEMCHSFKASLSYLYVMTLPSILVTTQQHIRVLTVSFLCVYFNSNLYTNVSVFSLRYLYYLRIHSHLQHRPAADVSHLISAHLVFLDHPNVIFWSKESPPSREFCIENWSGIPYVYLYGCDIGSI